MFHHLSLVALKPGRREIPRVALTAGLVATYIYSKPRDASQVITPILSDHATSILATTRKGLPRYGPSS
jgi:hypothetical protein